MGPNSWFSQSRGEVVGISISGFVGVLEAGLVGEPFVGDEVQDAA
jgi:hypothetical protein